MTKLSNSKIKKLYEKKSTYEWRFLPLIKSETIYTSKSMRKQERARTLMIPSVSLVGLNNIITYYWFIMELNPY